MSRFRGERASDALDLQQLLSEYCFELDLTGGLQAHRFFTADGRLEVGKMSLKGHEAMKVFYQDLVDQAKTSGTERTTRHLWSNLRISFEDENRVFVDFIMQNFSAIGAPPVFGATSPTIVADCRIDCRRQSSGEWRIAAFTGAPIFVGDDPVQNKALID